MHKDSVLCWVLQVTHDAKCLSSCVYSYFHRQQSDNFIPSNKCLPVGRMVIEKRDWAVRLKEVEAIITFIIYHNL